MEAGRRTAAPKAIGWRGGDTSEGGHVELDHALDLEIVPESRSMIQLRKKSAATLNSRGAWKVQPSEKTKYECG